MEKRWTNTCQQLKKLRFTQASVEMKVRAIQTKVYAAAFYGIEAAEVAPAKVAKLAAAVIDTFRAKNNNHNAVTIFSTITDDNNDIDPVAQILTRRILKIRRACCKKTGNEERYKKMIGNYAEKQAVDG